MTRRRPTRPRALPSSAAALSALLDAPQTERVRLATLAREDHARGFQENYGQSLERAERAAKDGDVGTICRLIEWDKSWLFRPETVAIVTRAVVRRDRATLRRIARGIPKLPPQSPRLPLRPRRSPNADNRTVLRAIDILYERDPEARKKMADPGWREAQLRDLALGGVDFPTKFLDDRRYFVRFLRRNRRL